MNVSDSHSIHAHWKYTTNFTQCLAMYTGILVGTSQKNSPLTCWVTTGQIALETTKNSQWTCWVSAPLPPVVSACRCIALDCPFSWWLYKSSPHNQFQGFGFCCFCKVLWGKLKWNSTDGWIRSKWSDSQGENSSTGGLLWFSLNRWVRGITSGDPCMPNCRPCRDEMWLQ